MVQVPVSPTQHEPLQKVPKASLTADASHDRIENNEIHDFVTITVRHMIDTIDTNVKTTATGKK